MVSRSRWRRAQRYERDYWRTFADRIVQGSVSQLDWYAWRAGQLAAKLDGLGLGHLTGGEARVIEIGSGPIGLLAYFEAADRVAVDPLAAFYADNPVLTALRRPQVRYLEGVGERLPCGAGEFDLAIIDNCIDHVQDVDAVMREITRVLHPGGILYFTVNCRTAWGFGVHRVLSRLRIDPGHPHTFTPSRVKHRMARSGFRNLYFDAASPSQARREDLASPDRKTRIKGLLGTSEFIVTVVAQRVSPRARVESRTPQSSQVSS